MFGKKNKKDETDDVQVDSKELERIQERLDEDETVVMSVRQSRVKPGGAAVVTPNTVFVTEKRVIIRNPIRLGIGEHIEEYFYRQITNVRLEKGLFSASLVFAIPGMTEISKLDRKFTGWGRDSEGTIDAIPKDKAEKLYDYIREKIAEAKNKQQNQSSQNTGQNPLDALKMKFVNGEITEEEYEKKKKILEG